jgi:hypothetical protein
VVLLIIGLVAVGAYRATERADDASRATRSRPSVDRIERHTVSGDTDGNTAPFDLDGGDYVIRWSVQAAESLSECLFSVFIFGPEAEEILNVEVPSGRSRSAEAYIYGVPAGSYHFRVISARCGPWTLTITGG